MTEKPRKKILVLWSGGLDSTYLVYMLLQQGHTVCASYVELQNNDSKVRAERRAIESLLKEFKKYPYFKYVGTAATIEINGDAKKLRYRQTLLWLLAAAYKIDPTYDEVTFGYVMNDDMISYLEDIRNIWNSFSALSYDGLPKLSFYLTKEKKSDVYNLLPEKFRRHVVWCELPHKVQDRFISCGKCIPCKRMTTLLKERK